MAEGRPTVAAVHCHLAEEEVARPEAEAELSPEVEVRIHPDSQ